jgi:hypothetical protein
MDDNEVGVVVGGGDHQLNLAQVILTAWHDEAVGHIADHGG